MRGITKSNQLFVSKGYTHARYGGGQYLTDISPDNVVAMTKQQLTQQQALQGNLSLGQVSSMFFNRGNLTGKISHYIEIDITGLPIRQGLTQSGNELRSGVQFMLNDGNLDLSGRIVRHGKVLP